MALDHPKQLVPCLFILLAMSSVSQATVQQCKIPDPNQDWRSNYTMDDTTSEFYLINKASDRVLNFFRNMSDPSVNHRDLLGSDVNNTVVLSTIGFGIGEVQQGRLGSFSATILYQPPPNQSRSGLSFLILPYFARTDLMYGPNGSLAKELTANDVASLDLFKPTSGSAFVSGSSVSASARIGVLANLNLTTLRYDRRFIALTSYDGSVMVVDINIDQVTPAISNHSVWIDYDRVAVYVDFEGKPKPVKSIVETQNISSLDSQFSYFGLLSTTEQLLRAGNIKWSATVEDFQVYPDHDKGSFLTKKVTIMSSVMVSVAAAAAMAAAVACYLNSRYRRWHKDLDKLAKSMERLPGVPTKVDIADISKATHNFHEDMKLGGGGFGNVYRCTLPAAASKTERQMDVAIKRFTRDVQNRCYDDFLAEVSIINPLRHKNIVPLIGWSYNKGVPLLVFEFMTNDSLDQHLFHTSHNGAVQRHTGDVIRQWATRYEIVRGIAMGLHYVHHEYEPVVLHRDIKASNIMLDSSFQARFGDFGLACTMAVDRNTVTGVGVIGLRALADHEVVDDDDMHITDRVWRLHHEGRLLECVDANFIIGSSTDNEDQLDIVGDVERLLLLGLACSNPNPSDRPTMPDVVRVIAKSASPPQVPRLKPIFVWPPQEEGCSMASHDGSTSTSMTSNFDGSMVSATQGHASF